MVTLAVSSRTLSPSLFDGRYQILDEVGKGGFSRVLRAEDTHHHNRLVAIKQLRQSGLPANQREIARQTYRREVAILGRLRHDRIPTLHDSSLGGSLWYLVLDVIIGETLESYLRRQTGILPLHEVLAIGLQLCEVLEYLHTHRPPIKFRDLKPTNIMRKDNGELMLIDFGLASPFHQGEIDTATLGTTGYAAPEQYPNQWGQGMSTLQSDLYSLGVILHRLLSGECPAHKPLSEIFIFSSLAGKAPVELVVLIAQMLKREREQRISSIQQVKQGLQAVQVTSFCL